LLIFSLTLLFFLVFNLLIIIAWPIYSKFNSQKHSYIEPQIDLLGLSANDLIVLNNETWKNYDKFRFVPFAGHSETNRSGKFLNFTENDGRKVNRPIKCDKNIYLYGGSTTFGYNVTDNQTIGQYLQELLPNNYCVYNHGRAYYYSKQENNLFINHIEEGKKINSAFFLDGINERCGGYEYMNYLNYSFSLLIDRPYLMWKSAFKNLLLTLPVVQFYNSLFLNNRWIRVSNNNILKIDICEKKIDLGKLYETRISTRNSICKQFKIECYSILQPMAGTHGVQIRELLSEDKENILKKKYIKLSSAEGQIDLGYIFENDSVLSYIDGVHYSPASNKKIATELYNKFLK
jgi:hypothetical protein